MRVSRENYVQLLMLLLENNFHAEDSQHILPNTNPFQLCAVPALTGTAEDATDKCASFCGGTSTSEIPSLLGSQKELRHLKC